MAINATAVWEVRTTGNNLNGAGYDPGIAGAGTDYTQQDTAQLSLSDLAATQNSTTVTSSTGGFTSAMIGNALHITSGTNFVAGYYFITAVASSTSITVDRAPATAGAGSAGVGRVGGGHNDPGLLCASVVGGNLIWIKSGTYTITSATVNVTSGCLSPAAGTTVNPTKIIGYGTSRGDNGNKPLLQASAITVFSLITIVANGNYHVENIAFDGQSLGTSNGIKANAATPVSRIYRCKFSNFKDSAIKATTTSFAILCEATGCSTSAAFLGGNFYYCTAHDNTNHGFSITNSGQEVTGCIASNNTGASIFGISIAAVSSIVDRCTIYGNGGDGINITAGANQVTVMNTICENNGGYGFNTSAVDGNIFLFNCGGFNNTSGLVNSTNIALGQQIGLITATSEIFNNAAGNDFSLNTSTTGGALFRAAGIAGNSTILQLPGLTTLAYPDTGAVQHRDGPIGKIVQIASIGTY